MKKFLPIVSLLSFLTIGLAVGQNSTLTAIHGIPGNSITDSEDTSFPVDVYLNEAADPAFTFDFADSVDNLVLEPGDYKLDIYPTGADPEGNSPALSAEVTLEEDENYTVIAHLTFTGDPENPGITLSLFENDLSEMELYRGRLGLRHTANAPEVALKVSRFFLLPVTLPGFSNNDGDQADSLVFDLVRGAHRFDLRYQGQTVFSTGTIVIQSDQNAVAYAIGDFFTGSFQLFIQAIN